eukprot:11136383-Alexandrium_andersonii.AAC.1
MLAAFRSPPPSMAATAAGTRPLGVAFGEMAKARPRAERPGAAAAAPEEEAEAAAAGAAAVPTREGVEEARRALAALARVSRR